MGLIYGEKTRHNTRYRYRTHTDMKFLGRCSKVRLDRKKIQLTRSCGRCLRKKIKYLRMTFRRLRQQEPTATETGKHRFGNTGSAHRTQRSIKCVTAFFKQYPGCLRGLFVSRRCNPQGFCQSFAPIDLTATMLTQPNPNIAPVSRMMAHDCGAMFGLNHY